MLEKITAPGVLALIPVLLALKKAIESLQLLPMAIEGMHVASRGGDFGPYIVAMLFLIIGIFLPLGILRAIADI